VVATRTLRNNFLVCGRVHRVILARLPSYRTQELKQDQQALLVKAQSCRKELSAGNYWLDHSTAELLRYAHGTWNNILSLWTCISGHTLLLWQFWLITLLGYFVILFYSSCWKSLSPTSPSFVYKQDSVFILNSHLPLELELGIFVLYPLQMSQNAGWRVLFWVFLFVFFMQII